MELKSTDYALLIQYVAQRRHLKTLSRTQINKILFYVYGVYMAKHGNRLFSDDQPRAWPYGPVFPKVYKWALTLPDELVKIPTDLADEFSQNKSALEIVIKAVDAMCKMPAIALTRWSHQEGSPWYRTLYDNQEEGEQAPWNTPIKDELIKSYFSEPKNLFK